MSDQKQEYYEMPHWVKGDTSIPSKEPKKSKFNVKLIVILVLLVCLLCVGLVEYKAMQKKDVSKTPDLSVRENIVYEAGEPVSLTPSTFVRNKIGGISIDSNLKTDKELYTYNKKSLEVVSKGKAYLAPGTYTVTLSLDGESRDVNFVVKDTKAPEFVDFKSELNIDLNAQDVDLSKYFLATDLNQAAKITVDGDVDFTSKGDYTISVIATDESGNQTSKECIVHIVEPDDLVTYSCMIDGSVPVSETTKEQVEAGAISFDYEEVSETLKNAIDQTKYDTSSIYKETYYKPEG